MKLCKDCKWMKKSLFDRPRCVSPKNPQITNAVTGEMSFEIKYCKIHRGFSADFICGKEGRWFEPK